MGGQEIMCFASNLKLETWNLKREFEPETLDPRLETLAYIPLPSQNSITIAV
jgi:hypothetical protein